MLQNILALTVVILAAIISVFAVIRSLVSNNSSGCDGCTACEGNDVPIIKRENQITKSNFQDLKIAPSKMLMK